MKKGLLALLLTLTLTTLIGCGHNATEEVEAAADTEEVVEEIVEETTEEEEAPADLEAAAYGTFADYSAESFAELKGSAPVALFFHAEWCSTCLGIESAIEENVADLPEGTTILEANFDTETELKKEYGVNMQSTLVFFDADGNEVERLNGASTFDQIKAALMASQA